MVSKGKICQRGRNFLQRNEQEMTAIEEFTASPTLKSPSLKRKKTENSKGRRDSEGEGGNRMNV